MTREGSSLSSSKSKLFFIFLSSCFLASAAAMSAISYSNATLTSMNGNLSVVVYLPSGLKPQERAYYYSSRFEHGSMIGSIIRRTRKSGDNDERQHILFENGMWREPHNSNWPESGLGLASEFGVGDDGDFCFYRCGWPLANDVTNGVLGYRQAKNGESFLKIGVGELIKGSCPACDSTEDYRFNSPYLFAKHPDWKISRMGQNVISLEHQATLNNHGYKLVKEILLIENVLSVTSTLTNLGEEAFSTAWYSHNFFTCDGNSVGPGYSVDFNLKGDDKPLYEEPGTWSWSTPLREYATIRKDSGKPHQQQSSSVVRLTMTRALDPGVRIKTEFVNDGATNGGFTLRACHSKIQASIPQVETGGVTMYAYNLYIERGTFSPEPQILINLAPGASTTWTQRLVISDSSDHNNKDDEAGQEQEEEEYEDEEVELLASAPADSSWQNTNMFSLRSIAASTPPSLSFASRSSHCSLGLALFAMAALVMLLLRKSMASSRLRHQYTSIPDHTR